MSNLKEFFSWFFRRIRVRVQNQPWARGERTYLPDTLVDVVIVNWKRPKNVEQIIDAFLNQTVPCRIILVHCKAHGLKLRPSVLKKAHVVLETHQNMGGYNRYLALPALNSTYTYFHDDDNLPGKRLLAHYIDSARANPNFAVLGQAGRNYSSESYNRLDVPQETREFVQVDSIVQSYFVKTTSLMYLHAIREELTGAGLPFPFREDDLALCFGLQHFLKQPCFLTPAGENDPEERFSKRLLAEDFALWSQPGHADSRTRFLELAMQLGWCRGKRAQAE